MVGNVISSADYRTDWLMEAMASESALEVLEQAKGRAAVAQILELYKHDLLAEQNGRTVESAGPVDFGYRLEDDAGRRAWQAITYEKGAWILWMLRNRMGSDGFTKMQAALLHRYANHTVTNDDFRKVAAGFLAPNSPDRSLQSFFDSWITGAGIPSLTLQTSGRGHQQTLKMGAVDDDFEADVPLSCTSAPRAWWPPTGFAPLLAITRWNRLPELHRVNCRLWTCTYIADRVAANFAKNCYAASRKASLTVRLRAS